MQRLAAAQQPQDAAQALRSLLHQAQPGLAAAACSQADPYTASLFGHRLPAAEPPERQLGQPARGPCIGPGSSAAGSEAMPQWPSLALANLDLHRARGQLPSEVCSMPRLCAMLLGLRHGGGGCPHGMHVS